MGRRSDDAVHDVDLQGVEVGEDFVTLGTGVLWDVHLLLPISALGTWGQQGKVCFTTAPLKHAYKPCRINNARNCATPKALSILHFSASIFELYMVMHVEPCVFDQESPDVLQQSNTSCQV